MDQPRQAAALRPYWRVIERGRRWETRKMQLGVDVRGACSHRSLALSLGGQQPVSDLGFSFLHRLLPTWSDMHTAPRTRVQMTVGFS